MNSFIPENLCFSTYKLRR